MHAYLQNRIMKKYIAKIKHNINKILAKNSISLKPNGAINGYVLLSYFISPFLLKEDQSIPNSHTNQWECFQIANTFLKLGYAVDVINYTDEQFLPAKNYSFFIDIHRNLERLSPHLNADCIRILHITGAHWLFQNQAEYARLLALQKRRGITLAPRRIAPPSLGIEIADLATILGNEFTIKTFTYAKKPIYRIPISTTNRYEWMPGKNYEKCRNNFLWFGSSGMVHKGLDLVLEAFSEMPEYNLTVCGPIQQEEDFEKAFFKELYQTSNIHTVGWIDTSTSKFTKILESCIGLIYPSCSEGGGGSAITCMHGGLIPILSYESSVDVLDFGFILNDSSINEIKKTVNVLANLPAKELKMRSRKAWEFVRANHTKERFSEEYQKFVIKTLKVSREVN